MKLTFREIKEGLSQTLKKISSNLLLVLVLFLVLDLVLGGIFFWQYYLKAEKEEPQVILPLKINQALLQRFSSAWQEREELFGQAALKQYPELFNLTLSEEEEDEEGD